MTTHICDIIAALKQTDGSEELTPRTRAHLVMKGLKALGEYKSSPQDENAIAAYLTILADKYLRKEETREIIVQGMSNILYTPRAA